MSHPRPECEAEKRESKKQKFSSATRMVMNIPLMNPSMPPPMYSFFQSCMQSADPPEAFYQGGVFYFLRDPKGEFGLDSLKLAAESGHAAASYILGIHLICNGGEREGVKLLAANVKTTSRLMRECRNDLKYRVRTLGSELCKWSIKPKLFHCPAIECHRRQNSPILSDEEEDRMLCQNCRWNLEIYYVDCLLRVERSSVLDYPQRCQNI